MPDLAPGAAADGRPGPLPLPPAACNRVGSCYLRPGGRPRDDPTGAHPIDPSPATGQAPAGGLRVIWEGPQASLHSFAAVNREVCLRLLARGVDLGLAAESVDHPGLVGLGREPAGGPAEVHVRHQWPPNFERPPSGRWVLIQPWEFGSPPKAWVGPMIERVDEVWAYTRFVRDCYVAAGVPPGKVHVVPLGVDPDLFRPTGPALPLSTRKRFRFLFVGGTIVRKGIDILLNAYALAFRAKDDVCLVVKDLGASSIYQGQTSGALIARFQAMPDYPELEFIDRPLSTPELAGLYRAADCLVHPYRGEGFGLPIAEAMACGLPAIVTGYGASADFADASNAYPILARPLWAEGPRIGDIETVDVPWGAQPDLGVLASTMRHLADNPAEARRKGEAASAHIRSHFTWSHAADAAERRLAALAGRVG